MDKHAQFKEHIVQVQHGVFAGLSYYAAWRRLMFHEPETSPWSLERQNAVVGRWPGFFTPASFALRQMALLEFAKLFDRNARAASLVNLLAQAEGDPTLVPHAEPGDLDEVAERLSLSLETRQILTTMRNQQLAHTDRRQDDLPPLLMTKIDALAADVQIALNKLSGAHDRSVMNWERAQGQAKAASEQILAILAKELDRERAAHDDEMVRIGVEHVRDRERAFGRRLTIDEVRAAASTIGFTPEQRIRIEAEFLDTSVQGS